MVPEGLFAYNNLYFIPQLIGGMLKILNEKSNMSCLYANVNERKEPKPWDFKMSNREIRAGEGHRGRTA